MVPDPTPTMPPGFDNFTIVLNWVTWAAIIVAFIAFVVAAARLGIAYRNGEAEGAKGLLLALVACIVIGSAAGIVNAIVV